MLGLNYIPCHTLLREEKKKKKKCWWDIWLVDHTDMHFLLEKKKRILQLFNGSIYSSSEMCFLLDEWIVITPNNRAFNSFVSLFLNTLSAAMWLSNVCLYMKCVFTCFSGCSYMLLLTSARGEGRCFNTEELSYKALRRLGFISLYLWFR